MASVEHYTLDPTVRVLIGDLGLSLGNVLRRAGLPGDLLSKGPASLDAEQAAALWEAIAAEANDPALPIRIGQAIRSPSRPRYSRDLPPRPCGGDRVACDRSALHSGREVALVLPLLHGHGGADGNCARTHPNSSGASRVGKRLRSPCQAGWPPG